MGASRTLNGFSYLPRQDGCSNGTIAQYEFYISADGVNWGSPVSAGTFTYGNAVLGCTGASVLPARTVTFAPRTGQYIRLRALSEVNGLPLTSGAELTVLH